MKLTDLSFPRLRRRDLGYQHRHFRGADGFGGKAGGIGHRTAVRPVVSISVRGHLHLGLVHLHLHHHLRAYDKKQEYHGLKA